MFGSGSKPSLGLSISTAAANAPKPSDAASGQRAGGSLFGGFGSTAAAAASSESQPQGGLFGSAGSQPSSSGGLFGASTAPPAQSGGLFGSTTSQAGTGGLFGSSTSQPASSGLLGGAKSQAPTGGLSGNTSSHPSQSGDLFGTTTSQPASGSGLFGTATSQAAPSSGLFGSASQATQGGGGLFGAASSQPAPTGGLFGAAPTQPSQGGGLFGAMPTKPSQGLFQPTQGLFNTSQVQQPNSFLGGLNQGDAVKAAAAATLNLGQQSTHGASASNARIDLEHLRPTTKFDQLTEDLQREIVNLDTAVLNEINRCHEVSNLLPTIAATGSNIANDVAYVTQKLEEVETGLENDADEIQNLKEITVKKDANEARVCFREVDRLKMPSQYQFSISGPASSTSSGVYGGHGLSGWWNHPQTLQRSIRGGTGAGGSRALQLPGDDEEKDGLASGPTNLVDFFDRRTEEMKKALAENKSLLAEIEEFVVSVESKIAAKHREVMGREGKANRIQGEEDPVDLLRYVFGEFERSLYEVADKVGGVRDGVQELVLGGVGDVGRTHSRLAR